MKFQFNILRNESGDAGDGGGGGSSGISAGESQTAILPGNGGSLIAPSQSTAPEANGGNGQTTAPSPNPQSDPSSPFSFASLIGPDGKFVANYHEKLPEGLKEHAAHFQKYGSPEQVLQHTLNLQQLLGKKADAVVIPGPDAPKEEWAPVLKRLGVPDSPDGYGLKVPEKLPPGVSVDPAEVKEFSEFAHGLGLTPQQAAKLQEFDMNRASKQATGLRDRLTSMETAEFEKQKETLAKEWGTGQDFTKKSALAERAALTFGFTSDEVKSDPLFKNARFVMTLARAGAAMSEDTLAKGGDLTSGGGMKAKAQDVISNPANPMYKKYWDGDEGVNEQVRNWMRAGG